MVRVIKRDCSEVDFDKNKISTAILKAMKNGSGIPCGKEWIFGAARAAAL